MQMPQDNLSGRDLVVREIFTSEFSYVVQLDTLVEVYIGHAVPDKVWSQEETKAIFSNIVSIRDFNRRLLEALYHPLDDWREHSCIGNIFLEMYPFFKIYHMYCDNYENALKKLEEVRKRQAVKEFLKSCEAAGAPSITSLLITPVQRIPRYLLLLKVTSTVANRFACRFRLTIDFRN